MAEKLCIHGVNLETDHCDQGQCESIMIKGVPGKGIYEPTVQYGGPDTGICSSTGLDFQLLSEGKQIGKFWFDEDSMTIKFEGDADESAKIFIEASTSLLQAWVDNKNTAIDKLSEEIRLLKEKIKLLDVPDYMVEQHWVADMEKIESALLALDDSSNA